MLAAASDSNIHDTVLIGAGFCTWNRYGKHLGVRKAEEHEYEHEHEHEHEPVGRMLREQAYCRKGDGGGHDREDPVTRFVASAPSHYIGGR